MIRKNSRQKQAVTEHLFGLGTLAEKMIREHAVENPLQ